MSGAGVMTQVKGVLNKVEKIAHKGIRKGVAVIDDLASYEGLDFAGRILSAAINLKQKSEQPSIFAHQVRPAPTQTAPAQAQPSFTTTTVEIAGRAPKAEDLQGLAQAAVEFVEDGLLGVLKGIYQSAPNKAIRLAAKEAIINQRQLEAA